MQTGLLNVHIIKVSQASVRLPPSCSFTGQESEFSRDDKDFECHGGGKTYLLSQILLHSIYSVLVMRGDLYFCVFRKAASFSQKKCA